MKEIQVNTQLPVIKTNFAEVKESLIINLEKYKGIIVTEENQKDCKAMQKELAGLRNQIDTERKAIKKQVEAPIKQFDGEVKELVGLISEVEGPIKEGISIFDDKRRNQKRVRSQEIIANTVIQLGLEKKYADQLTVLDKYLNLSGTEKSVVEDINQRAEALKQQQSMEKAKLELLKGSIETTLEAVNTTIKTPLKYEDFEKYIEMGWDATRLIREINDRARMIREAEKPKEELKEKLIQTMVEAGDKALNEEPIEEVKEDSPKFFVDVYVESDFEHIQALSRYLQANGYKYEVHKKGRVENE